MEGREGNLLSPYALTKRINEEYGKLYYKLYGLETIGLRYFNVFGKRQNPDGPYAAVILNGLNSLKIMKLQPLMVMVSRAETLPIENVIEANLKACLAHSDVAGEIFNIASGERVSLDIYRLFSTTLKKDIKPIFGPERIGDIKHSNADITKAQRLLGYEAGWGLRE